MSEYQRALTLLAQFENKDDLLPKDAELLVGNILRACGHTVTQQGFAESSSGVDLYFESDVAGDRQRIGVEVKYGRRPVHTDAVNTAMRLQATGQFNRCMVVARGGFTGAALKLADEQGAGKIDLFSPTDLRNWMSKYDQPDGIDISCTLIIREAMRALALRLAEHPDELRSVEWRDLERILRETFEGIGYQTRLTRSGKDGGFDLELVTRQGPKPETFLIEVKHWTSQKPGLPHLKKLVHVTASRMASGALMLSTSGFAKTIYSGLANFQIPVCLGDSGKIISLCREYYRLGSAIWLEDRDLKQTLFEGTTKPGIPSVSRRE